MSVVCIETISTIIDNFPALKTKLNILSFKLDAAQHTFQPRLYTTYAFIAARAHNLHTRRTFILDSRSLYAVRGGWLNPNSVNKPHEEHYIIRISTIARTQNSYAYTWTSWSKRKTENNKSNRLNFYLI